VATQPSKAKAPQVQKTRGPQERSHVMASVKLDVASYSKVSAIAALEGVDKSTWMSRVIVEAIKGVVVIDRRGGKAGGKADLADSDNRDIGQDEAS
jgi:hypothetical protein